jgi:hypothetical protein
VVLTVLAALVGLGGPAAATPTTPTSIDDVVSWWQFDEGVGSTAIDVGGSGNDATLHSPAGYTSSAAPLGITNPSAFHSTISPDSYATAPGTNIDNLQQYSITVWARVDPNPAASFKTLISLPGKAAINYNISSGGIATLIFDAWRATGDRQGVGVALQTLTPGTWYHLALTVDGQTIRGYLNGVQLGSIGTGGPSHVGAGVSFSDSSFPFDGSLDDVRIYPRALSDTEVQRLGFTCQGVTEIPQSECLALADLFTSTNGASWTDHTGWLQTSTPCETWHGVGCTNGHVQLLGLGQNNLSGPIPPSLNDLNGLVSADLSHNHLTGQLPLVLNGLTALNALLLGHNQLSGGLPASLGRLTALQSLDLSYNAFSGDVPTSIINLTGLSSLDVGYNGLTPTDPAVRSFFTNNQPTWAGTQTVPPTGVAAGSLTPTSVALSWTPIAYTGDGGYYEVLASDPGTGTLTPLGRTTSKTATGLMLTGLTSGATYHLAVRTITPAHPTPNDPATDQQNAITSDVTAPIDVTLPPPTVSTTVGDNAPGVTYNSWAGVTDPAASGGSYRVSRTANATASFPFTGTMVRWLVREGPDRGKATVTIDGLGKGTVDLYAASPSNAMITFSGLASRSHRIVVKVLGTKRAAASAADVTVDGFKIGSSPNVQETASAVGYDSWSGTNNTAASSGRYRSSGTSGSVAAVSFTGTGVTWITAFGPSNGRAAVSVDGSAPVAVDLYRARQAWQASGRSITGLSPGAHRLLVRVLGTKNAASTGSRVVVDGFIVRS